MSTELLRRGWEKRADLGLYMRAHFWARDKQSYIMELPAGWFLRFWDSEFPLVALALYEPNGKEANKIEFHLYDEMTQGVLASELERWDRIRTEGVRWLN